MTLLVKMILNMIFDSFVFELKEQIHQLKRNLDSDFPKFKSATEKYHDQITNKLDKIIISADSNVREIVSGGVVLLGPVQMSDLRYKADQSENLIYKLRQASAETTKLKNKAEQLEKLNLKLEQASAETSELKNKAEKLENLNAKLKRDVVGLQGELKSAKTCFGERFEIEKLAKTNAVILELEKKSSTEKKLKLEDQKKLVNLQKSYDESEKINLKQQARINELLTKCKKINRLELENCELKIDNRKRVDFVRVDETSVSDHETKINELESELANLKVKLESVKSENTELQDNLAAARNVKIVACTVLPRPKMLVSENASVKHISKKEKRIHRNRKESQNEKIFVEKLEDLKSENLKLTEQVQSIQNDLFQSSQNWNVEKQNLVNSNNIMNEAEDGLVKEVERYGILVNDLKKHEKISEEKFEDLKSENLKLTKKVRIIQQDSLQSNRDLNKTNNEMMKQIVRYGIMVTSLEKHNETLQRLIQQQLQHIACLNSQLEESRLVNYFNFSVYY